MYATQKDREYLEARGFSLGANDTWVRACPGGTHHITPVWEGKGLRNVDCPSPEHVFWVAGKASAKLEGWAGVVSFADQCPDPVTAFVTAEVRAWQRQT